MSLYELLGTFIAVVASLWGYNKWLLNYISDNDKHTNQELSNLIVSLQRSQEMLWEKHDRINERLIVLDHTTVNESNVRVILEEYRLQSKSDKDEIKQILNELMASLNSLKTEAAIAKAMQQREVR